MAPSSRRLARRLLKDARYGGVRRVRSSFPRVMEHMYAAMVSEDLPLSYTEMVVRVADVLGATVGPNEDFEVLVYRLYDIACLRPESTHTLRPFDFEMDSVPRSVYGYVWVS